MTDRTIRNLAHLRRSASTARVLNLLKVSQDHASDLDWAARPMFRTPALNRSLIIKHRLRRNEIDLLRSRRQVATKVVVPIDMAELKSGGRYVFVDQHGFERVMREAFGLHPDDPDMATLRLMDGVPSLDPFLLREQLRRGGVDPAPCYFAISDADLQRMSAFVQREIQPLVALSAQTFGDVAIEQSVRRMASKILSNAPGDRMEALGVTLRLEPDEYQEGVFCWKGFLYYKWLLTTLLFESAVVADAVWNVRPSGPVDKAAREYLDRGRSVLRHRIGRACDAVGETLRIYDDAYTALTIDGQPMLFRDFLLRAPDMFTTLGEQLGAIQHIVSFWRFRFSPGAAQVSTEELIDIFMDFETGLRGRDEAMIDYASVAA